MSQPGNNSPQWATPGSSASAENPGDNPAEQQTPVDGYNQPSVDAYAPSAEAVAGPKVVQTDADAKDGLTKCPSCGATDIALNVKTGSLRCHFCRHEWQQQAADEAFGFNADIGLLTGVTIGSGSSDIIPSTEEILSFKCSACGAEVVIDTNNSTQARCHWCRNTLSMNQQIPNGAVPDMILPFSVPKAAAVEKIKDFVGKRQFFAHPKFRQEFTPENVMGVYLPYMVVDVNAHAAMVGVGEHETRRYQVGNDDNKRTVYDADVYDVAREFDILVDDLTVESSTDKLDRNAARNTNNIINTIMPFDTKKGVRYDSNYLAGFTSEKRDVNIDALQPFVQLQAQDIARHKANETLRHYDRGVRWENEQLAIKGERWVSAYLPVWLYSYYERKGNQEFVHYVAVNGQTGETMGSVPVNIPKLLLVSAIVEVIGAVVMFFTW